MHLRLEIPTGPEAGKAIEGQTGQTVQVGRLASGAGGIATDPLLSNLHFELDCDAETCYLRDLNSHFGTRVNGMPVREVLLKDGDQIRAGQTNFLVRIRPEPTEPEPPLPDTVSELGPAPAAPPSARGSRIAPVTPVIQARVLRILCERPEPLFALLDAARDSNILPMLRNAAEDYCSLYEGEQAEVLADFAPYLVRLPVPSSLTEALVHEGWGNSWGVYLTSTRPAPEVSAHLRQFLLVRDLSGNEVYFRYYDPRVLRVFLPVCTAEEAGEFFGPVSTFLLEGHPPTTLVRFDRTPDGLRQQLVSLPSVPPLPAGWAGGEMESSRVPDTQRT
jgi:hypothetical protein